MNKQGVLRTLEVVIAIVISLTVLVSILPHNQTQERSPEIPNYFIFEEDFRDAVLSGNSSKVEESINSSLSHLYPAYNFVVSISDNFDYIPRLNASTDVYSKTFFISSNLTTFKGYFVRVYYWKR